MDFIKHNMPVIIDETHICVRIREILGECDEIFAPEKSQNMESNDEDDDDSSINNEENKSDGDEDDDGDDDEFYDDGLEYNPVRLDHDNDIENYIHGGEWILEITTNDHNGDTPNSLEFDNIREEMWSENSNIPVTTKGHSPITV
ncbi:hypothetical protein Tco_0645661 [Tanacetum coccineum]